MADESKTGMVQDVMSSDLQCVSRQTDIRQVARLMKEHHIGDVVVTNDDGKLYGIVTDRDIVVRGLAEGGDADEICAGDICSRQVLTLPPDASIESAVQMMREHAIRRVPVLREGEPIGIVSIGDLALLKDPRSALSDISGAPPTT
jgi:CBS domain-containing protein